MSVEVANTSVWYRHEESVNFNVHILTDTHDVMLKHGDNKLFLLEGRQRVRADRKR